MTNKKIIHSNQAPAPIGPYSQAVQANGFLFISGQIAIDPSSGKLVTDNITAETNQVMKNIKEILNAAKSDFSQVIKCSIFLSDMSLFPVVNDIYGQFFSSSPPARETIAVKGLPKEVNVEISCIATVHN